jgi:hypothetical protein
VGWQVGDFNSALVELERLGALLMVTSRRAVNARLDGPLKLHLLSLAEQDAIQLLRSRACATVTEEEARELATICGCNALAITIIAAFLSDVVTPEVRLGDWRQSNMQHVFACLHALGSFCSAERDVLHV